MGSPGFFCQLMLARDIDDITIRHTHCAREQGLGVQRDPGCLGENGRRFTNRNLRAPHAQREAWQNRL